MPDDFYHDHTDRHAFQLMNRLFGVIFVLTFGFMGYAVTTRLGHDAPPPEAGYTGSKTIAR